MSRTAPEPEPPAADRPPLDDYREARARAEQNAADRRTALGFIRARGNEAAPSR
ncbi:hypothetical protein H8N00_03800 [Streptomyces sp. AC563]|uniref:hypothetical protein n=1 Tax=Streptomyces buecherae TaxID=2763006 RepID=UPI00164D9DCF|nr:hypothetical protein [Streptomyces buecherae]MBC3988037.1 hypothetical protein [Streptomyces buecherae]